MNKIIIFSALLLIGGSINAQKDNYNVNKFKQLHEELSTPNVYRTGGGAPGSAYYQNKADYQMDITLDDAKQKITGYETITYRNDSPDALEYLWIQLDQNVRANSSDSYKIRTGTMEEMSFNSLVREDNANAYDGGTIISEVIAADNKELTYTNNKTMMRANRASPHKAGETYT